MVRLKNKSAFTLIELVFVMTILGILSTIVVSSASGLSASASATTCQTNRATILRLFEQKRVFYPELTLDQFLANPNHIYYSHGTCPDDGEYTAAYDSDRGVYSIVCSVHSDVVEIGGGGPSSSSSPASSAPASSSSPSSSSSSTPGGQYIPGTSIPVNSTWPADSEFYDANGYAKAVNIYKGQTYYVGGYYYIVVDNRIDLYSSYGVPTPTSGWWWTPSSQYSSMVRFTGRNISWNGGTSEQFNSQYSGNLPTKGDTLTVNGKTYVFALSGQGWVDPPNVNTNNWVEVK